MYFFRKIRKNKFIVLAISVIVICLVYTGIRKTIDNYSFNKNSDIVSEDNLSENEDNQNLENPNSKSENRGHSKDGTQFEDGEVNLELESNSEDGKIKEEKNNDEINQNTNNANDTNNENNTANSEDEKAREKMYIYITGEVNVPGVVILNEGSRIVDAINAAGGITSNANITKVNLVYVLEDGMKVNIPNDNDLKNNPDFEYITLNSGDGVKNDYSNSSSASSETSSNSNFGNIKKYSIVNINNATQTELETLPGIGPSLALKIINYRKTNGKFASIEDIKNVSGIGDSKFEEIKKYIVV